MAPTINKTKLVATAIATFVSTDKFIISPSPQVLSLLFLTASNFSALMDAKAEGTKQRVTGLRKRIRALFRFFLSSCLESRTLLRIRCSRSNCFLAPTFALKLLRCPIPGSATPRGFAYYLGNLLPRFARAREPASSFCTNCRYAIDAV